MGMPMIRIVTGLLAVVHAWWGGWAYFAPRHFFDAFPGAGHRWTAAYPPYNEHLVADLGATFLTLAVLLAVGTFTPYRQVRRLAVLAVAVFAGLHLAFHLFRHGQLTGTDLTVSLATLVLGILLPLTLLVLDRPSADRPGPTRPGRDHPGARRPPT